MPMSEFKDLQKRIGASASRNGWHERYIELKSTGTCGAMHGGKTI